MNKIFLEGRVAADGKLNQVQSGKSVFNFVVITNSSWKDAQGVWQERAESHKITAWGNLAESAGKRIQKGTQVFVEGAMANTKYEKDGEVRYGVEVKAKHISYGLGQKPKADQEVNFTVDDVPF